MINCRGFEHLGDAEEFFFGKGGGQDLQTDGQLGVGEPAGDADAGDARQVGRDRVDVREVHGQRVVDFLADFKGRFRRRRAH